MADPSTIRDEHPPLNPAGESPVEDEGLRALAIAHLRADPEKSPVFLIAGVTHNPTFGPVFRADHIDGEGMEARRPLERFVAWRMPDGSLGPAPPA